MDRIRMTIVAPTEGVEHRSSEVSTAGTSVMARAGERLREQVAWLSPRLSWNRAALGLLALIVLVVIATFADYGVTWDEDVHNWYGVFVLDYYLTLFKDSRCLNWLNLYNYGAAFDTIAAALNHISPFGTYETRHLLNGAFGIFGIIGGWKLGRCLGGPRAGFIAALLLLAIPNYYGQMFNNPKDIPFAVGMVWSIYYMVRIIPLLPRPKWSLVAKLGVAGGMALGVRVGGLLVFCYLGLLLLSFVIWRTAEAPSARRVFGDSFSAFWRVLLPTVIVAYPVMLLFWPCAQESPIGIPLPALIFFSHETFPYRTLFAGQYFAATDLPWAYLPTYIALALPELVLALVLAAPVGAVLMLRRLPAGERRDWLLRHGLVAFAIVFPVTYALEIKAVLFAGMRHFIFLLPLIAVAAALVADRLLDRLSRFEDRPPGSAPLTLYGIGPFIMMSMLHPQEFGFYNRLFGGGEGSLGA